MPATRPTSSLIQVYGMDECKETELVKKEFNREKQASRSKCTTIDKKNGINFK